jgi:ribosomal protein S18 acetylase RimI-like enzyme
MDTNDHAGRENENLLAWLRVCVSGVPDAVISERRGIAVIASGLPYTLFNRVLVSRPDASPEELAAAVTTMRERGAPFNVSLRRRTDDAFVGSVLDAGLELESELPLPGMALAPIPPPTEDPPGFEIRRVTDAGGVERHIDALVVGYGLSRGFVEPIMTPAMLGDNDLAIYVGLVDGEPLVSGFGVRTGRTIGVYNIATAPAVRGRGYGAAMTARIATDGAAVGCDLAILQASTMGFPIYERMGYRTVTEYDEYGEPEES